MRVLAIGAHPDDVELGCGGALAAHCANGDTVGMLVMTNGSSGPTGPISRQHEQVEAARILGAQLYWGGLVDCEMTHGRQTISVIEQVVAVLEPDIIYTHGPHDSHQDHVAVSHSSVSAARNVPTVLFYESPSALGFDANVFVDISAHLTTKLAAIQAHASQVAGSSRVNLSAVEGSAKHYGLRARVECAEPFYSLRMTLGLSRRSSIAPTQHPAHVFA